MSGEVEHQLAEQIGASGPFVIRGDGTSRIGLAEGQSLRVNSRDDCARDDCVYDPAALTLVVSAGMPMVTIEALLAGENQRLAFEPPDLKRLLNRTGQNTIGGVVATNASGPRRVTVGACRDFCLGMRFVDGRGQIIKNGGRVMKNVTGLDLVKLMAGSHGTLGIITQVSLKTQSVPELHATLGFEGLSEAEAVSAMSAALGTPYGVTGAAHLRAVPNGSPARTLLRLEGFEPSVIYRVAELQNALAAFGPSDVEWDQRANTNTWADIRDVVRFVGASEDVWHVSVKPSAAATLVRAIAPLDVIYDWGGGRLWLLTAAGTDVRAKMGAGHATLIRASDATKRALGVFHPENAVVARLSHGLRTKFDPDQKFNRGMMR